MSRSSGAKACPAYLHNTGLPYTGLKVVLAAEVAGSLPMNSAMQDFELCHLEQIVEHMSKAIHAEVG